MAKLHYWVENGGDGSASACFVRSEDEAVRLDEDQSEGWSESSAGHVELRVHDGTIQFRRFRFVNRTDSKREHMVEEWIDLED